MDRSPRLHPNSAQTRAQCERCPKRGPGVVLRLKTTSALALLRALLCDRCAKRDGWEAAF